MNKRLLTLHADPDEHSNRECYEPPFDGEEPQTGSTALDLAGVAVLIVAVCSGVAIALGWLS